MSVLAMETAPATVSFGGTTVPYAVQQTKHSQFAITVYPDQRVLVRAPSKAELADVHRRVRQKARWIVSKVAYFEAFKPLLPPRRYISGESHVYLGRQYRLKVIEATRHRTTLRGRYLSVETRTPNDPAHIGRMVKTWYARRASELLAARFEACRKKLARYRLPDVRLTYRRMKTRWGSCTGRGTIVLNPELVKAPLTCIDYAIIHELCHLRIPNHSSTFFSLLQRCLPDWKARKARLDRTMASIA